MMRCHNQASLRHLIIFFCHQSLSATALSLKRREIHHIPARAITVQIMRLIIAVGPPNIQATRSNSKRPTSPQLIHPIIARIRQILSNIDFTPLKGFLHAWYEYIMCEMLKNIHSKSRSASAIAEVLQKRSEKAYFMLFS